jgi:hypothetical protein
VAYADILTLINELESENKRLSDTEIGELIKGNEELAKQCVGWVEIYRKRKEENQQLKDRIVLLEKDNELLRNAKVVYETVDYCYEDLKKAEKRIAELEKENGELLKENEGYHGSYRCAIDKIGELSAERYIKVEQFAERLKEKYGKSCSEYYPLLLELTSEQLDETLKEFI